MLLSLVRSLVTLEVANFTILGLLMSLIVRVIRLLVVTTRSSSTSVGLAKLAGFAIAIGMEIRVAFIVNWLHIVVRD